MDRLIVERKLDSLQRCLKRLAEKRPKSPDALAKDIDLQDVLVLNLSRAVQICVDLAAQLLASRNGPAPETMGQAFERLEKESVLDPALALRMRKAVGFRNLAVHAYEDIDWNIVFAIVTRHLGDFEAFARIAAREAGL